MGIALATGVCLALAFMASAQAHDDETIGLKQPRNLQPVLDLGEKAARWLETYNSRRATKFTFSDKKSLKKYPITKPVKYGPSTIFKTYDETIKKLPNDLREVLLEGKSERDPKNFDEFLKWGKKIHKNYDTAMRWLHIKKYFQYYQTAKTQDVRSFLEISKVRDVRKKLSGWEDLSNVEQKLLPTVHDFFKQPKKRRRFQNSLMNILVWQDLFMLRFLKCGKSVEI
jgi:hypothetical protein